MAATSHECDISGDHRRQVSAPNRLAQRLLVVGLILVAASEEIIFRRLLRNTARPYLGDGAFAVLITSLMFGAHHWWSGVGNILLATIFGILFMVMYWRSGALWPVVLAHYLVDLVAFAGIWRWF
ncbi:MULTISPECIES: CPBP family intramembrane glutamic endopeptidase [Bradyrhizobium]|uniref:CPBP family intramembrane glutamic endopeptidase n=1 Tax=Bradyrhizobium TaxID=374 RepID=UPI001F0B1434|nr:CPBP family intramembrane glutamic endopeptidase [Bradyrhizobium sp. CCBAU 15635]